MEYSVKDEDFYLKATEEVEHNAKHKALWAKAMALAYGEIEQAKYTYIKLRVDQLNKESKVEVESHEADIANKTQTQKTIIELTFDNLGVKRKLFLLYNWVVLVIIFFVMHGNSNKFVFLPYLLIFLICFAYVCWLQIAISKRKVVQLKWLAAITVCLFLNPTVGLFLNPVVGFIVWKIAAHSSRELNVVV